MLTRRRFLHQTGAAGIAALAGAPRLLAAKYDLLIKGGRVIDPSRRLDAVRDVAISGGRIAAVDANLAAADAASTIDAAGKLVTGKQKLFTTATVMGGKRIGA